MSDQKRPPADASATPESRAFGRQMSILRSRAGFGVVEFAAKIGRSHAWVSRVESGHFMPRAAMLETIARTLGVSVATLMGEADVPPSREDRAQALAERALSAATGVPIPLDGRVPANAFRFTEAEQEGRVVFFADADVAGCYDPRALEVSGDCLRAVGIFPGDIVVVDRNPNRRPRTGELVVVRLANEYTLKFWHPVPPLTIELRDGNGTVVERIDTGRDQFEVWGYYVTVKPLGHRW